MSVSVFFGFGVLGKVHETCKPGFFCIALLSVVLPVAKCDIRDSVHDIGFVAHAIPEAEPSNFEQMVFAIRSLQMSMIQTGNYLLIATAAVIAVERAVNAFDLSNRFVLPPISGFDSN